MNKAEGDVHPFAEFHLKLVILMESPLVHHLGAL